MDRNKQFSALFVLFTTAFIILAIEGVHPWLMLWFSTSTAFLAIAYYLNLPWLVCGKNTLGQLSFPILLANLPWLIFTWCVWLAVARLSREPALTHIPGTNLWISRYPLFGVELQKFDMIIDLTAEFPSCRGRIKPREFIPNLDGVALSKTQPARKISPDERILVHCAQGHGRSATFASILLAEAGIFPSAELAYHEILKARPAARVSQSQLQQILAWRETNDA